jgi:copper homeostasis protein CutC
MGDANQPSQPGALCREVGIGATISLAAALSGGAHPIELCTALALAALSPSPGLTERARGAVHPSML